AFGRADSVTEIEQARRRDLGLRQRAERGGERARLLLIGRRLAPVLLVDRLAARRADRETRRRVVERLVSRRARPPFRQRVIGADLLERAPLGLGQRRAAG